MGHSPHHRWQAPSRGLYTGTRWPTYLSRDRALDPYLIWADSTGFLGFGGWDRDETQRDGKRLPLLLAFDQPGRSPADTPELGLLRIPAMYLWSSAPGAALRHAHATGLIQAEELEKLLCCQHLTRFQLGAPRLPGIGAVAPALDQELSTDTRTVLGFIDHGCAFAHPQMADSDGHTRLHALWDQGRPAAGHGALTGLWRRDPALGYGMELRRAALREASRYTGHQDDPAKVLLAPYEAVDYVPQRLSWGLPATRRHAAGVLRPPLESMAADTHGTATMDLAMGREPPLRRNLRRSDTEDRALRNADRSDDWAAVFVQLPASTVVDTTGGSLAFHVVDGLHYIVDRAQRIGRNDADNPGDVLKYAANPIVVTLGYGALAGSHDGTSIAELAIDELVNRAHPNRLWVVLAAGNAHHSRSHASLRLRPGEPGQLVWAVPPDNPLESYLEIWLPEHDSLGQPLAGVAERMLVEIQPPGAEPTRLALGQWLCLQDAREADPARGCVAGAVFARRVAQSDQPTTMVLLASAPTRRAWPGEGPARAPGRAGDWSISLTWAPQQPAQPAPVLEVHAWVERSDLVFGPGRRLQSRVQADAPHPLPTEFMPAAHHAATGWHDADARLYAAFGPERGLGSMSGGASARDDFHRLAEGGKGAVLTVGAYRLSDGEMSADSSGGPDRRWTVRDIVTALRHGAAPRAQGRQRPDADAPGDRSPAVRGLPVAGTRPGGVGRLSATSAAAPTVARAIASARTAAAADALAGGWRAQDAAHDLARRSAGQQPPLSPKVGRAHPARGTPQPTLDDLFRRGRWRAR